jgi:hypothetical protein
MRDRVGSRNASYTPEEQAGMTHDGAIATMTTPSELREYFESANKPKPTGHITYCNAGIMGVGARGKALDKNKRYLR